MELRQPRCANLAHTSYALDSSETSSRAFRRSLEMAASDFKTIGNVPRKLWHDDEAATPKTQKMPASFKLRRLGICGVRVLKGLKPSARDFKASQ